MAQLPMIREIESQNHYERQWKIKTNSAKFTIVRLGSKHQEEIIADDDVHLTSNKGKILGLTITKQGYNEHIQNRRIIALRTLHQLYRFSHMSTKIKTQLVKTLILPILDYPPVPTHTLSKTQIRKLQIIQNKALRFATGQRYPYTLTTQEIHTQTKTLPINQRLHWRAEEIWKRIELLEIPLYTTLKENNTITKYNQHFPSSLSIINNFPDPIFH